MPVLNNTIGSDGALVRVRWAWGYTDAQKQRAALRPVPPPVEAMALLDTGAEVTCLDRSLVQTLGLPFGNITLANLPMAGGLAAGNQYDLDLTILHPGGPHFDWNIRDLPVLELSLGPLAYQALIGRDLLNRTEFLYGGRSGTFTLTY
jgi:Aspartyl protease